MKILLVKPYNLSDHIQPSLGLGYLATAVRRKHEVSIVDCIKDNIKLDRLGSVVRKAAPDVVGIQCYTFDLAFVREALRLIKHTDQRVVTVVGGPHPSALPEATMEYFGDTLDFAFRGEVEVAFPLLLDYLGGKGPGLSGVHGLVWRERGSIRLNDYYFEEDLDSLGTPAWDLIRPQIYPEAQHGAFYKKFPIAPLMLTRGCPFQCTFCAGKVISGSKLRKRSIAHVIAEIKMLYHDYGIREFHIIDDNFTLDKAYAKTFLNELIKQGLDISWAIPNGVRMETLLDTELLGLMKESGLYLISLGIESGSDRILRAMKKDLSVQTIREAVGFIRRHGFDIAGFFILGFPGERREDIRETIRLSRDLDLIRANFFTYLPFPGTESYRDLAASGGLEKVDWKNFYFMNAAYVPDGLTKRELKRLQRYAFLSFYCRPRILFKNLLGIRSPRHLWYLLRRFYHWMLMR